MMKKEEKEEKKREEKNNYYHYIRVTNSYSTSLMPYQLVRKDLKLFSTELESCIVNIAAQQLRMMETEH